MRNIVEKLSMSLSFCSPSSTIEIEMNQPSVCQVSNVSKANQVKATASAAPTANSAITGW